MKSNSRLPTRLKNASRNCRTSTSEAIRAQAKVWCSSLLMTPLLPRKYRASNTRSENVSAIFVIRCPPLARGLFSTMNLATLSATSSHLPEKATALLTRKFMPTAFAANWCVSRTSPRLISSVSRTRKSSSKFPTSNSPRSASMAALLSRPCRHRTRSRRAALSRLQPTKSSCAPAVLSKARRRSGISRYAPTDAISRSAISPPSRAATLIRQFHACASKAYRHSVSACRCDRTATSSGWASNSTRL